MSKVIDKDSRFSTSGFSVKDILRATGGRLLQGKPPARIKEISIDTRTLKAGQLFIAIKGSNFDGHDFIKTAINKSAAGIIISHKKVCPLPKGLLVILVKDSIVSLGDIARFHRQRFNLPVIAVTGSNGKTTTKEMIAVLLQQKYPVLKNEGTKNNQIGVPLALLRLTSRHKIAVLEFGTNHPGEINYLARIALPTVAVITNIEPAHLEFFKNLSGVFKEKKSLLDALGGQGIAVLNNDDPYLRKIKNRNYKIITFGIMHKSDFQAKDILRQEGGLRFKINRKKGFIIHTPTRQNVYNCLAAVACASLFKVFYREVKRALRNFRFLSGRMEVKEKKGIKIIDDTYNANPASFRCAIETLAGYNSQHRKIAVCADMKELGRQSGNLHHSLGQYIARTGIDNLISVGRQGRYISLGAEQAGMSREKIFHVQSAKEAAKLLSGMLRKSDVVLIKGSRAMGMELAVNHLLKG